MIEGRNLEVKNGRGPNGGPPVTTAKVKPHGRQVKEKQRVEVKSGELGILGLRAWDR